VHGGTSLVDLDLGPKDTEHRARSPAPLGSSHISWSCRNSLEVSPVGGRSPFFFLCLDLQCSQVQFLASSFLPQELISTTGILFLRRFPVCASAHSAQLARLSLGVFLFSAPSSCLRFVLSDFCHYQKFPG
jgi:hypothetical protein